MDKKLTLVIGIWISGVIAGVLLVARWMAMGQRRPQDTPAPDAGATSAEPAETEEDQHGLQRFSEPIKAGAKADIVRVRKACTRVSHKVASTIGREHAQVTEEPVPAEVS